MVHVHREAWVSPTAVLRGDVVVGAGSRVLDLVVIHATSGRVTIGRDVVVMEHAVLRGRSEHPLTIGDAVLVGPHAHLNGTTVEDEVFIATGASLFPGSRAGVGCELRINSVLHVNSRLAPAPSCRSGGSPRVIRLNCSHRTGMMTCGRSKNDWTSRGRSTG